MRLRWRAGGLRADLIAVCGVALAVALWRALAGDVASDAVEDRLLDLRFRLRGAIPAPEDVVIVALDERTVAQLGWSPPPRQAIAEAVGRVIDAGPVALALDLLLLDQTAAGPALAAALARYDRVVLAAALGEAAAGAGSDGLPAAESGGASAALAPEITAALDRSVFAVVAGGGVAPGTPPPRLLLPRAEIVGGATLGHVNVTRSGDGVARRVPLALWTGSHGFLPAMPLAVARNLAGLERGEIVLWAGSRIAIGPREVPTDRAGQVAINHYGGTGSIRTVSLVDVIGGRVPPETFAGRAVIFGATAESLSDRFATPFAAQVPGVEILATVAANIARGDLIGKAPVAGGVLALVAAMLVALAGRIGAPALAIGAVAGLWLAAGAVVQLAFGRAGVALDATSVLAALGFATAWVAARRLGAEHRESETLAAERGNLARYVSPLLSERLARGAVPEFDRRTQDAAVLFVDVAGYTSFSEGRSPGETAGFLRDLHRLYERCAAGQRGVISSFEGDGAMVIFGLPEPGPDDAARALACGRALLAAAASFASDAAPDFALRLRVSLHFGPVTAAVVGGETQAQVTVTGDTVNVASRLQDTAKQHGAALVLSRACLEAAGAGPAGFLRLPDQPVRGRSGRIEAWALD